MFFNIFASQKSIDIYLDILKNNLDNKDIRLATTELLANFSGMDSDESTRICQAIG